MYTLYYSPGACSMAVHFLLNEVGAEFKLENTSLAEGKNRSPEFQKLNPRGQIPVLIDEDGDVIREGGSILIHLCEKYNSPLLPKEGKERARALEWLMFCNSTLHPAYARGFFVMRNTEDENAKEQLLSVVGTNINKLWEEIEERLGQHKYLCGDKMTIADVLMTVIANWSGRFSDIKIGTRTKNLLREVSLLPSYQKALAAEQVEYFAAA